MDTTRESWRAYSDHVEPPPHFGAPTVQLVSGTASTFTTSWGVTPSMVQTAFDPLCSCLHRRSGLPSRLKSATPTMFQSRSGTARMVSPPTKVTPLIYQTKLSPVEVLRQTISGLPSALKSEVPTIRHSMDAVGSRAPPVTFVPSINHTKFTPVAAFRQRRSGFPSPLKSARGAPSGLASSSTITPLPSPLTIVARVAEEKGVIVDDEASPL